MKKWISLLLTGTMLLSCIATLPIFAAEAETEVVLYEENFEAQTVGEKPAGITCTENAEKQFLSRVTQTEDGGKALYIHHAADCACGSGGGPRASTPAFDISKAQTLKVNLRMKSANGAPEICLRNTITGTEFELWDGDPNEWADVEITVNLSTMAFEVKANGSVANIGTLAEFGQVQEAQLRLYGVTRTVGAGTYYDDIKISTIGEREIVLPENVEPKTTPTRTEIPQGAYVLTNTDLSDAPVGTAKSAKIEGADGPEKLFTNASNYTQIVEIDGNRVLRFGAADNKSHGTNVDFQLPDLARRFTMNYAVLPNYNSASISLYSGDTRLAKELGLINVRTKNAKQNDWNYVHLEIDLENSVIKQSINGEKGKNITFDPITDFSALRLNMLSSTKDNMMTYFDNIALYTTDEVNLQGKLLGNEKIYWPNVKPVAPLSESSYVNNLKQHPRLFVDNWDAMREKVNADYFTKRWYQAIKAQAAQAFTSPPTEYTLNSRSNIIGPARSARDRIAALAFCYKMEGKKEYLDQLWSDILHYGDWPDWSGFQSSLCTAELVQGYAYAYDWLYDDLTAEQKAKIIEIIKAKALPDFIYHYENGTGFSKEEGNWNPVCNTSNIMVALAIADEEPNISEYLLELAPQYIWYSLEEWAPQGAYMEPVSYWNYGTNFLAYAQFLLDHAFVEGFEKPAHFDYTTAPGIAETAEFQIYYTGPVGMLNYGDCVSGASHMASPATYWAATTFDKPQYAWWLNNMQAEHATKMNGTYYYLTALAFYNPDKAYYIPGAFALDKFYSSEDKVNGAAMRSSWEDSTALYAAMQGGTNTAGHQHLSLGTFVIDYMGKRFVNVLDKKDYSFQWGNKKVAYWRRAEGYNCLVINPSEQQDQKSTAMVKLLRSDSSDNTAFGIFDMTDVHDDYVSAKRGIMMTDNRRRVLIQDEAVAKMPSEFYWYANTDASVAISPDGKSALLTRDGDRMLARIVEAPAEAVFELVERKSLATTVNNDLGNQAGEKLRIHVKDKTELNLCVEFVALKDGEGMPAPWTYTAMDNWTTDATDMTATAAAGSSVVLKLNTPNAIANGEKTFVDPQNADVVPFTENGRTLVPVRFISEAFGANVSWNESTQTVGVKYLDKDIKLVIGSNQMLVNGEIVTLDIPANTYNSRTLIPLRALVEALGKKVFWDDRGLISIGEYEASYTEQQIAKLISMSDIRVMVNGKDAVFFDPDRTQYAIDLKSGEAIPQITASVAGSPIEVTQANAIGESAAFTIHGKTYTIKMQPNIFEGIIGHKDPGIVTELSVGMKGMETPDYDTFIYVENLTDSTDWEKYPPRGIVDGIIEDKIAHRWAAEGAEQWIQMDFGSVKTVHSMGFNGLLMDVRAYDFDVFASEDGINYTLVHEGGLPTSTDIMQIIPLGDVQARYIKLVGYGSNQSAWNTWSEVRFYESEAQQNEDIYYWPSYFVSTSVEGKAGTSTGLFVSGIDAYRNTVVVRPDATVTYVVADPSIATVTQNGVITFLKAGVTTVTVTVTQDGFTAKVSADVIVQ